MKDKLPHRCLHIFLSDFADLHLCILEIWFCYSWDFLESDSSTFCWNFLPFLQLYNSSRVFSRCLSVAILYYDTNPLAVFSVFAFPKKKKKKVYKKKIKWVFIWLLLVERTHHVFVAVSFDQLYGSGTNGKTNDNRLCTPTFTLVCGGGGNCIVGTTGPNAFHVVS